MVELGEFSLDRMVSAVQKVRERLERCTKALNQNQVPYAVAGGCAVAAWVSRIDESAVRNTPDVDILIRRCDLENARAALESVGFVYRHDDELEMFLDGENGKPREAIKIHFSGEYDKNAAVVCPDVSSSYDHKGFSLLHYEAIAEMELSTNSIEGKVNVRDLIDIGLINSTSLLGFRLIESDLVNGKTLGCFRSRFPPIRQHRLIGNFH